MQSEIPFTTAHENFLDVISEEANTRSQNYSQLPVERVVIFTNLDILKLKHMSMRTSELSQPQRVTRLCSQSICGRLKSPATISSLYFFYQFAYKLIETLDDTNMSVRRATNSTNKERKRKVLNFNPARPRVYLVIQD